MFTASYHVHRLCPEACNQHGRDATNTVVVQTVCRSGFRREQNEVSGALCAHGAAMMLYRVQNQTRRALKRQNSSSACPRGTRRGIKCSWRRTFQTKRNGRSVPVFPSSVSGQVNPREGWVGVVVDVLEELVVHLLVHEGALDAVVERPWHLQQAIKAV